MAKVPENTEEKIIAAARQVFLQKGMDGARMQEIADTAGINKALLHYYFRSKDKLFECVFSETFGEVAQVINQVFREATGLDDMVEKLVTRYIRFLQANPILPQFVLHELNRNPKRLVRQFKHSEVDPRLFLQAIRDRARADGLEANLDPFHLIVNIIGLCAFPFIARPIIEGFLLGGSERAYAQFIDERTQHIVRFVQLAIHANAQ